MLVGTPPGLTPQPLTPKVLKAELIKQIKQKVDDYKKRVNDFILAKSRLTKLTKELATYQSDGNQYPEHTRAFKSAVAFTQLEDDYSLCSDSNYQFVIFIRQGSTRRGAMLQVHHSCMSMLKSIEVEAQHDAVTETGRDANASFLDEITDTILTSANEPDPAEEHGCPRPDQIEFTRADVNVVVQKEYRKAYAELNKKLAKSNAATSQADQDEDLSTRQNPEDLFGAAVVKHVKSVLSDLGLYHPMPVEPEDNVAAGGNPSAIQSEAQQFLSSIVLRPGQGNVSTPPGGHNTRPAAKSAPTPTSADGKGKGKGKGKSGKSKDGKAKGKGKSKGYGKQKGKDLSNSGNGAGRGGRPRGPRLQP